MPYVEVKNKKGTSENKPPSGYKSWLDFWEKKKGTTAKKCEAESCSGSADVGGHVIRTGEGPKEYILPICFDHNNKSESYKAWETDLVPVS